MRLIFLLIFFACSAFGAQQTVNVGNSPNDGAGDGLRTAFTKVNANFTELYARAFDPDISLWAATTPSANGLSLVSAADYAAMRTQLGLVVGTDVQAYDPDLTTWAGFTPGAGIGTFLATPTSANLAAAVTNETGTGSLVFATSPTLTTPVLGAATATSINGLTLTSSTGGALTIASGKTLTSSNSLTLAGTDASTLNIGTGGTLGTAAYTASTAYQPAAANLTTWAGIAPGTGVGTFLGTPTSANLASAITNETGSGSLVFGTSPTLVTPTLGAATATSVTVGADPYDATTWNANLTAPTKDDVRDKLESIGYSASLVKYGGVGDCVSIEDATMSNGSAIMTSASGLFTPAMVGKSVGVGAATLTLLKTTVASYQSPTQITLADVAPNAITTKGARIGTDNTAAFQAAFDAMKVVGGPSELVIPQGKFLVMGAVLANFNNGNQSLVVRGTGAATKIYVCSGPSLDTFYIAGANKFVWRDFLVFGTTGTVVDAKIVFRNAYVIAEFRNIQFWNLATNGGGLAGAIHCGNACWLNFYENDVIGCTGNSGNGTTFIGSDDAYFGVDVRRNRFIDIGTYEGVVYTKTGLSLCQAWVGINGDPSFSVVRGSSYDSCIDVHDNIMDEGALYGIYYRPRSGGRDLKTIRVTGNRINGATQLNTAAIYVAGVQNAVITDNWAGYNLTSLAYVVYISNVKNAHIARNIGSNMVNKIGIASGVGAVDNLELVDNQYTTLENAATFTNQREGGAGGFKNLTIGAAGYGSLSNTVSGASSIWGNSVTAHPTTANQVVKTTASAGGWLRLNLTQGFTIHTGLAGAAGTAVSDQNSLVAQFNSSAMTLTDAVNIAVGSTTGTKIGTATTQKMGFWNATPVVQPAANADTSGAALAALETEVNELKALLRSVGLMAP